MESNLQLSPVVLGSMGFSEPAHALDIPLIHAVIERGVTSIDTAPLYGAGESERIIGQAIKDRRDKVQVLTKCGLRWDEEHGQALFSVEVNGRPWTPRKNSRRASILEEVDRCLERLGTEYIDLMQVHHWDPDTPLDETMGALEQARSQGKIRAIGVSNFPLAQLRQAQECLSNSLFSTQNLCNALDKRTEQAVLDWTKERGIRFLAYSPLAQGLLAGRLLNERAEADWRSQGPYRHPKNVERVNGVLRETALPIARTHGVTLAQLALRWALDRHGVSHVVVGGRKESQLLDAAGTLDVKLPAEALLRFERAIDGCGFQASPQMSLLGRGRRFLSRGKSAAARRIRNLLNGL